MYCIYCGKQLPDEAKFCFHCGKQTVAQQAPVTPEPQPVPVPPQPAPVVEPTPVVDVPTPAPVVEPEPVVPQPAPVVEPTPVVEPKPEKPEKPVKPKDPKKPFGEQPLVLHIKKLLSTTKGKIIAAAAALVVVLIVILCAAGGKKVELPDPDVYFRMEPVSVKKNNMDEIIHVYEVDENMYPAMGGYCRLLYEEYDGLFTNTKTTDSSTTYCLRVGKAGNVVDVNLIYYPADNELYFRYSDNAKIVDNGERFTGYDSSPSGSDIIDAITAYTGEGGDSLPEPEAGSFEQKEQQTEEVSNDLPPELLNRDPAVIPNPLDYDSSGMFEFEHIVTLHDDKVVWAQFRALDADAAYVGWEYIDLLKKMGYEVVEELNNGVLLSHPDVDAKPVYDGTTHDDIVSDAQLAVRVPVLDNATCRIYIQFLGNGGIELDGYVGWFQQEMEEENNQSGSSGSSSSGSGSSSVPSYNKDLYDNGRPCNVCDDGDCKRCGGDGYLMSAASDKEDRNCPHCNRGNCRTCGGDGWID